MPYVVFETAYTLYTRWTDHQPDRAISLLDPLYLTWFLAALFVWRLTTPIWKHVRQPLPLALVIAMLATLSPPSATTSICNGCCSSCRTSCSACV